MSVETSRPAGSDAGAGRAGVPRVLVVARGYPPSSDPTSYRWLRFTAGLVRHGWQVEVLTTQPVPRFEYFDPRLTRRIDPAIEVHRVHPGIYEPRITRARLAKAVPKPESNGHQPESGRRPAPSLRTVLRDADTRLLPFKIPDPTFEWIASGTLHGYRLFARRRYDLIVSSAAPFSSHVVAHQIHRLTRASWIADFSDPYASNPFASRPPWRRRLDLRLERAWFRAMTAAIVPVPEMKTQFLREHPELRPDSIHVIPYGFDRALYETTQPTRFDGFTVVHTGTFYAGMRDPGPFFQALARVKDLPVRVVHAGVLQPEWVAQLRELGLEDRFEVLGLLSREEIAPLQRGASCLLLIGNRGGLQLPGKLLDYLGARRPILALRNDTHDIAADLVERHGAGHVVANEADEIARGLRQLHDWWCDGSLDGRYVHDGAMDYAWPSLEERLDRVLRSHLPAPKRPVE